MSLPERSPGKQRPNCWLKVGTVPKVVTVRSKVGWFYGHWSGRLRRSLRCPGEGCPVCASGAEPRVFTYVMVELEDTTIRVWEIPERLYDLARELELSAFEGVGCVVHMRREGTAQNSPIAASIVAEEVVEELDIGPFLRTLGVPIPIEAPEQGRNASHATREHVPG